MDLKGRNGGSCNEFPFLMDHELPSSSGFCTGVLKRVVAPGLLGINELVSFIPGASGLLILYSLALQCL